MAETATIERVADQLQRFVDQVQNSQLGLPTPCTEWDVHALLDHVTTGGKLFAVCIRDGSCPDGTLTALMSQDQVGDDPSASFRASASEFLDTAKHADGDKVVATPWGEMPVSVVVDIAVADLTIHTIDLARAIGADLDGLDPQLLGAADELAHRFFPAEGRDGMLAAPVDVDASADAALKLSAFAGRAL